MVIKGMGIKNYFGVANEISCESYLSQAFFYVYVVSKLIPEKTV